MGAKAVALSLLVLVCLGALSGEHAKCKTDYGRRGNARSTVLTSSLLMGVATGQTHLPHTTSMPA